MREKNVTSGIDNQFSAFFANKATLSIKALTPIIIQNRKVILYKWRFSFISSIETLVSVFWKNKFHLQNNKIATIAEVIKMRAHAEKPSSPSRSKQESGRGRRKSRGLVIHFQYHVKYLSYAHHAFGKQRFS